MENYFSYHFYNLTFLRKNLQNWNGAMLMELYNFKMGYHILPHLIVPWPNIESIPPLFSSSICAEYVMF